MTDYYVAKDGNDGWNGDEAQPWLTIQKAADTLIANDTVYIKNGNYNEKVTPQNWGSVGNYITYTAYPGHTPVIDGSGISLPYHGLIHMDNYNFELEQCNTYEGYIKILKLRIINAADYGFGVFARCMRDIIVENVETYNTASSGIGILNGQNITINNNNIEKACNSNVGECIEIWNVDTFEVKNNYIHHGTGSLGGEGIDVMSGSHDGKVFNNHIYDLSKVGLYVDSYSAHTYNIDIYNNVIHGIKSYGIALTSELNQLLEDVDVYNNIVYENQGAGIGVVAWGGAANHQTSNIKIINNTIYKNGYGGTWDNGGIRLINPDARNIIVRNNICSENNQFQIALFEGTNVIVDHNLIDGYRGYPGEIYGDDYVEGDPKFVNPAAVDFHLMLDSPAIDNGSSVDAPNVDFDGIARPQGAGYDIGAYEYALLGTISGIVTDIATGLPISGVKITADGYETYTE